MDRPPAHAPTDWFASGKGGSHLRWARPRMSGWQDVFLEGFTARCFSRAITSVRGQGEGPSKPPPRFVREADKDKDYGHNGTSVPWIAAHILDSAGWVDQSESLQSRVPALLAVSRAKALGDRQYYGGSLVFV